MGPFFFILGIAIVVAFIVWGYKAAVKAANEPDPPASGMQNASDRQNARGVPPASQPPADGGGDDPGGEPRL